MKKGSISHRVVYYRTVNSFVNSIPEVQFSDYPTNQACGKVLRMVIAKSSGDSHSKDAPEERLSGGRALLFVASVIVLFVVLKSLVGWVWQTLSK